VHVFCKFNCCKCARLSYHLFLKFSCLLSRFSVPDFISTYYARLNCPDFSDLFNESFLVKLSRIFKLVSCKFVVYIVPTLTLILTEIFIFIHHVFWRLFSANILVYIVPVLAFIIYNRNVHLIYYVFLRLFFLQTYWSIYSADFCVDLNGNSLVIHRLSHIFTRVFCKHTGVCSANFLIYHIFLRSSLNCLF